MTDNMGHIEEEIWFSSVSEEELSKYDKDAAFAAFQNPQRRSDNRGSSGKIKYNIKGKDVTLYQ